MSKTDVPCITIAMGSCSRAAGADDTLDALLGELKRLGMDHVVVRQVGCNGLCEMEPLVIVEMPNEDTVVYGKVDAEAAERIVSAHVSGGKILADQVIRGLALVQ